MSVRLARLALVTTIVVARASGAQTPAAPALDTVPSAAWFDQSEVMIPMRDGVALHTFVFVPKGIATDLPFILARTPYGIAGTGGVFASSYAELAREGYIFVFQDTRGRFKSEGQFEMLRSQRDKRDPAAIDEATDTFDTIEWMLHHVPHNNGRVGQL